MSKTEYRGKIYGQKDLQKLKRRLLGVCGLEAIRDHDERITAIGKTAKAPEEKDYPKSLAEETLAQLLERSRNNDLVYITRGDNFPFEPDNFIDKHLHIQTEGNGFYRVWISRNTRYNTWRNLDECDYSGARPVAGF